MKILHYCLGIPPYATGGLTIYALDLVKSQMKNNEVFMIYPGYKNKNIKLKKIKNKENINLYRIDGLLPLALTYGVANVNDFIGHKDISIIKKEFDKLFLNVDILHLHTIQGLYPEILEYFKNNNTKIILTTHDFYPFSLSTKLYEDELLNIKNNIIKSLNAPSKNILCLNRYPFINKLKKIKIIKKLFNKKYKIKDDDKIEEKYYKNYIIESNKLYSFYNDILNLIDLIHANSKKSYEVYNKKCKNVKKLLITHEKIKKYNIIKNENDILNIAYFGEEIEEKGFNLILDVLDEIYQNNKNFILKCYGYDNLYKRAYIKYMGHYKLDDLKIIYKDIDLVLFPTLNIESFGFVGLEALAYNTPLITSKNAGIKELCNKDYIINDKDELKELLIKIINDKSILNNYFNYDLEIKDFNEHADDVINILYRGES